jgi:hypothetical protein
VDDAVDIATSEAEPFGVRRSAVLGLGRTQDERARRRAATHVGTTDSQLVPAASLILTAA